MFSGAQFVTHLPVFCQKTDTPFYHRPVFHMIRLALDMPDLIPVDEDTAVDTDKSIGFEHLLELFHRDKCLYLSAVRAV